MTLSWRLAGLRRTPSGVPRRSTTRWRFVPGLPRSVGFGPVSAPPFLQLPYCCRGQPGSSPAVPPRPGAPGARGGAAPTCRSVASRAGAASMSSPSSPPRVAPSPKGRPSAARRRSRSRPHDHRIEAGRPWVWVARRVVAARSLPRGRRIQEACSCTLNAPTQVLLGAISIFTTKRLSDIYSLVA